MSLVTDTAFAEPAAALAHFERRLALETDCSDVHEALKAAPDFRSGRRARPQAVRQTDMCRAR